MKRYRLAASIEIALGIGAVVSMIGLLIVLAPVLLWPLHPTEILGFPAGSLAIGAVLASIAALIWMIRIDRSAEQVEPGPWNFRDH